MHPAEWLGLITPALAVCGIGYAGIVKLTRLIVAVETLGEQLASVHTMAEEHERRITALEFRPARRW